MGEVIGMSAKTIHRLLEFQGSGFKRCEENPLHTDFLIIDEASMLDISLTASLLKAVAPETALLFIGDADQLPSVGAGNVLRDLIGCGSLPCFRLTTIFRQAKQSVIINAAHQINRGEIPALKSPFRSPEIWKSSDCFFIDSSESTQQQVQFINRVKLRYGGIEAREAIFAQTPYDPQPPEEVNDYDSRSPSSSGMSPLTPWSPLIQLRLNCCSWPGKLIPGLHSITD